MVSLKTRRGEKLSVVRGSLCHVSPSRIAARVTKDSNALLSSPLKFDVTFQVHRKRFGMLHSALDAVSERVVFPQSIPLVQPQKAQLSLVDASLNLEQVTAIHTILSKPKSPSGASPSGAGKSKGGNGGAVVIVGPSGSGKSRTLYEALRQLSKSPENRVLVCAALDGTADSFVQNALQGPPDPKAIRLYETDSVRVGVVPQGVKSNRSADGSLFEPVTFDSIAPFRVVVTTYLSCGILARANVPAGHFTHIICDESGRVCMPEVLAALQFASENTRVVLSGDPHQLTDAFSARFDVGETPDASFLRFILAQPSFAANEASAIVFTKNYRINADLLRISSA